MTLQRAGDLRLTPRGLWCGGRYYPCAIGKGGIRSDKREGDGATPRGVHHVEALLYRPDRMIRPSPWAVPIGPRDLWSDAPSEADYNSHVRAPYAASHEALRRADPLYDLVLVLDWNYAPAAPYRGSAIFIHQWRRRGYPTEGCIALSRADLRSVAAQVAPGTRVIVD